MWEIIVLLLSLAVIAYAISVEIGKVKKLQKVRVTWLLNSSLEESTQCTYLMPKMPEPKKRFCLIEMENKGVCQCQVKSVMWLSDVACIVTAEETTFMLEIL